jgi:hypothetical protein
LCSIVATISAAGTYLTASVIYKGKEQMAGYFNTKKTEGNCYAVQESGYIYT